MMKEKIVIATIACNSAYFYVCCKNLIKNFIDDEDFIIYVLIDDENEFKDYKKYKNLNFILKKYETKFKYHEKFTFIDDIRKLEHKKICYIDSDMYLFDSELFKTNIKTHDFNDGLSYTRFGSLSFETVLLHSPHLKPYQKLLDKNNIYYKNVVCPWEDLLFFNFTNIPKEKVDNLFNLYNEYKVLRESCAHIYDDDLKSEGTTLGLAATNSEFNMTSSYFLFNQLKHLRDNHFPKTKDIRSIMEEVDFILLIEGTEENEDYIKTLKVTMDFYKQHFVNSNFIICEMNTKETLRKFANENCNDLYVFNDIKNENCEQDIILIALEKTNNKTFTLIENGSIIIDCKSIHNNAEIVFRGIYDYIIPFANKYKLPEFKITGDNFSGMFMCDKEKFKNVFSEYKWINYENRHKVMINNNFKFKFTHNDLISLDDGNPVIRKKMM